MTCTIPIMPRVRRPRRQAPVLELLQATLPELRRGLTESAARTVAYELFEKLGYGAVAVTDTHKVLAFVGAGADHHAPGDQPIRPVYEALAEARPLLAPLGLRSECRHPACPLGAAAVVPLQLNDAPAGAVVAFATAGSPLDETAVETLEALGVQLSAQLQLSELTSATTTALQAQMEPHFVFNALNTIAAFIRTEPERARTPRARVRRSPAKPARTAWRVRDARGGVAPRAQLSRARAGAVRLAARGDDRRRCRRHARSGCRRCSSSRSSRTRSSTARPSGRCICSCGHACVAAGCGSRSATTDAALRAT